MRDPARLIEMGNTIEVRVLASARGTAAPPRIRERLLGLAAATAVATTTAVATGASATTVAVKGSSLLGAMSVAKWVSVAVVAGVATTGTAAYLAEHRAEPAAAEHARGAVRKPIDRTAVPASAGDRTPVATARAAATVATPAWSAGSGTIRPTPSATTHTALLEELAILDDARAALDSGDTEHAIRQLDRHDLEYEHGQLAPDALALRIDVYGRRRDEAKVTELSRVFLARYADHPQAPRVRAILERTQAEGKP